MWPEIEFYILDDIVLSTKPDCEVKIRKIRSTEQFFLQEQALGL